MLLYLTDYLAEFYSPFGVFQYLTLRSVMAVLTALLISFVFGPYVIRKLSYQSAGQPIRDDGPETHLLKAGTPTMGGTLILISVIFSTLLWGDLENRQLWVVVLVTAAFGVIGFVDDYKKIVLGNSKGLSAKAKYFWQSIAALFAALVLFYNASNPAETELIVPFFKDVAIPLGWGFVVLTYFVIVGTSNAVNLTDGLDGLAIMPTVMVAAALGIFAYIIGNVNSLTILVIHLFPVLVNLLFSVVH